MTEEQKVILMIKGAISKVPPGVKNEYLKAPWFTSMTRDQGDAYIERISILCEDRPVTKEAHEIALREALAVPAAKLEIAAPMNPAEARPAPYEDFFGHTPPAAPLPRDVRIQNAIDKLRREVG